MAYPYTDTGYNMYDMISMLQKAIRRSDYENAGFAANQVKNSYRNVMWNRLLVITAEDCFGVVTKEILKLREQDNILKSDDNISNAVALLCRVEKNRDACYFACNFVLVSRTSNEIQVNDTDIEQLRRRIETRNIINQDTPKYDRTGFSQISLFDYQATKVDESSLNDEDYELYTNCLILQKAIDILDMDELGYRINILRKNNRELLWDVFIDYSKRLSKKNVINEIKALKKTDDIVNAKKTEKDEIFISKAAILLCQANDENYGYLEATGIINLENTIDWSMYKIKPINKCILIDGEIPEWVYDCHTLKGKRMGKTDWDMTTTEQDALTPLHRCYFDEGSWLYTYQQDLIDGVITEEQMKPILEYAKTHKANPVEVKILK